jgi:hypothetical protein
MQPTDHISLIRSTISQIEALFKTDSQLTAADIALKLKRSHPEIDPLLLSIAIDSTLLRSKAVEKLGSYGAQMLFKGDLLEQASQAAISKHRAALFRSCRHVLEIGTGTGADSAALAAVCEEVTSIECDPQRALLARDNLCLLGVNNVKIVVGEFKDIIQSLDLNRFDGLFADPARRSRGGERKRESHEYSPPLENLLDLNIKGIKAIKVSPGLFFDPPTADWRRMFLGTRDECLEQTLIYGVDIKDSSCYLADRGVGWSPPTYGDLELDYPERDELSGYISEAHAIINRSQHLSLFFQQHGIRRIAPDVSYGVSSLAPTPSPLIESFSILATFELSASRLRAVLKDLGWSNRTEFKKRNTPLCLDTLRNSLKLPPHTNAAPFGTVIIFRLGREQIAVVAERI